VYACRAYVDMHVRSGDTGRVPVLLKTRLAAVALIGIFLIPIGGSALRGMSHVLTCSEQVAKPFQVMVVDNFPIVTGASTLAPSEDRTLCGGLVVDMAVVVVEEGSLGLTVAIANTSVNDWFGTVQLSVGGTRIPVDLGKVEAGQEAERTIPLRVPEGTVEFDGSLLIGP